MILFLFHALHSILFLHRPTIFFCKRRNKWMNIKEMLKPRYSNWRPKIKIIEREDRKEATLSTRRHTMRTWKGFFFSSVLFQSLLRFSFSSSKVSKSVLINSQKVISNFKHPVYCSYLLLVVNKCFLSLFRTRFLAQFFCNVYESLWSHLLSGWVTMNFS